MRLVPIHEANDCHEPAGSPKGGQFCSGKGGLATERDYRRIGNKLWKAYAAHLTEQTGGEITFSAKDAEESLESKESDSDIAEDMKWLAMQAHRILTPREMRALLQESDTVAFRGALPLAGPGETDVVYHGTSSEDAAKIRAGGNLRPRGELRTEGNWASGLFGGMPSSPDLVYATTSFEAALDYARQIAKRQKSSAPPVVLRLKPDWGRAVPDEDVIAGFLFNQRPK